MADLFNQIKRPSVAETIVDQVKRLINQGHLEPGQKLPSERELAEQLKVGRSSVREATSALVALGIAEIRPGEGAFIRPDYPRSTLTAIEWSSFMRQGQVNDLLETRLAIEITTARNAALRATSEQRSELLTLAQQMRVDLTIDIFVELDIQFHLLLACASQNIVMHGVIDGIQTLMRDSMYRVLNDRHLRELAANQHQQMAEAIIRNDAETAETVMRQHLMKDISYFGKKND